MHVVAAFVANTEAAELMKPGNRSFNHPTSLTQVHCHARCFVEPNWKRCHGGEVRRGAAANRNRDRLERAEVDDGAGPILPPIGGMASTNGRSWVTS